MASCSQCGTLILWGGVRVGEQRFCNAQCRNQAMVQSIGQQIPEGALQETVHVYHQAACPKCQGSGPVDVHHCHTIWSALVITSSKSRSHVCCRSCAVRAQLLATAQCAVFGWWGLPWGLIMTPAQIARNLAGIMRPPDPSRPSPALFEHLRTQLAVQLAQNMSRQRPVGDDAPPKAGT